MLLSVTRHLPGTECQRCGEEKKSIAASEDPRLLEHLENAFVTPVGTSKGALPLNMFNRLQSFISITKVLAKQPLAVLHAWRHNSFARLNQIPAEHFPVTVDWAAASE